MSNIIEFVLTKYFENYFFMKNRLVKGEIKKCRKLKSNIN